MLNIFPKYKNLKTGQTSYLFLDVIGNEFEIDLDFISTFSKKFEPVENKTFIKDIILDYKIPQSEFIKKKVIPKTEFLDKILQAIKQSILRTWKSDRKHLIWHSGGYDSRVLSKILSQLRDEKGKKWLGHIIFICWEPESEIFEQIMKYEGWSNLQYFTYNKFCEPNNYQKEIIDFENCWEHSNGSCPPVVLFHSAYNQFRPTLGEDIQIYQALYFNEVFRRQYIYFEKEFSSIYFKNPIIQQFVIDGIPFIPILSKEVCEVVSNYCVDDWKNVRTDLLKHLDKDLFEFPNKNVDNEKNPYRQLANDLYLKCITDYMNSTFYQIYKIHPENFSGKNVLWKKEWWIYYNVASWVEYLRKHKNMII